MVRQLQDNVVLLNRVRDLEAERSQLVDGAPCPLCGATEHPYATGNVPCPDEAQKELELAREAAKETDGRRSSVKAELDRRRERPGAGATRTARVSGTVGARQILLCRCQCRVGTER